MNMLLSTPPPPFLAALLSHSATAAVPACSRVAALQFIDQYPNLPLQPRVDMRVARGSNESRGSRAQRYKRLNRSHKTRRNRPRSIQAPNMVISKILCLNSKNCCYKFTNCFEGSGFCCVISFFFAIASKK